MSARFTNLLLGLYVTALAGYSIFSYSLTAPNLILTSWAPYWNFQLYMWETFYNNRQLLAPLYVMIVVILFALYWLLLRSLVDQGKKNVLVLVILCALPLLLSNNALSYDVFNYIFNAKMVMVYQANPHVETAVNFLGDNWTRFMHNVHTPAPYGYGWTLLSTVPYLLGGGKFLLTWLSFRMFSLLSLVLLALTYRYVLAKKAGSQFWTVIVVLNPLLLIEIVSTMHNDLWMMIPAIWSFLLLALPPARFKKNKSITLLLSLLLLAASVSIKLGTLVLLPLWLLLAGVHVVKPKVIRITEFSQLLIDYWPLLASLMMFVPLLTMRSQQFHPWYLTWVMVWLPLIPTNRTQSNILHRVSNFIAQVWRPSILLLSLSSLLRYTPYLWAGTFEGNILWQQKLVTWVPFAVVVGFYILWQLFVGTTKNRLE